MLLRGREGKGEEGASSKERGGRTGALFISGN